MSDFSKTDFLLQELRALPPLSKKEQEQDECWDFYQFVVLSDHLIEGQLTFREVESIIKERKVTEKIAVDTVLSILDFYNGYLFVKQLVEDREHLTLNTLHELIQASNAQTAPNFDYATHFEEHKQAEQEAFITWSDKAQKTLPPIQYAIELSFRYIPQGPNPQCNWRVGWLLLCYGLMWAGYPITQISLDSVNQQAYHEAVYQIHKNENFEPYAELFHQNIQRKLWEKIEMLRQTSLKNK